MQTVFVWILNILKAMSRITHPIQGMFVLISMHFKRWFWIPSPNSRIVQLFNILRNVWRVVCWRMPRWKYKKQHPSFSYKCSSPVFHCIISVFGGYFSGDSGVIPAGTGQIWLDNLMCTGAERTLSQCENNGWGINNCGHSEDAGVECVEPGNVKTLQQYLSV